MIRSNRGITPQKSTAIFNQIKINRQLMVVFLFVLLIYTNKQANAYVKCEYTQFTNSSGICSSINSLGGAYNSFIPKTNENILKFKSKFGSNKNFPYDVTIYLDILDATTTERNLICTQNIIVPSGTVEPGILEIDTDNCLLDGNSTYWLWFHTDNCDPTFSVSIYGTTFSGMNSYPNGYLGLIDNTSGLWSQYLNGDLWFNYETSTNDQISTTTCDVPLCTIPANNDISKIASCKTILTPTGTSTEQNIFYVPFILYIFVFSIIFILFCVLAIFIWK